MSDVDGVGQSAVGVLPDFGGFGGGAGGPDGVVERLGCDHGAAEAVGFEVLLDVVHDGPLGVGQEGVGGDDVGIVGRPAGNADAGVVPDHFLVGYGLAGGGVEQGLALVGGGPLGTADKIPAPHAGRVAAATGGGESVDEGALRFAHGLCCSAVGRWKGRGLKTLETADERR